MQMVCGHVSLNWRHRLPLPATSTAPTTVSEFVCKSSVSLGRISGPPKKVRHALFPQMRKTRPVEFDHRCYRRPTPPPNPAFILGRKLSAHRPLHRPTAGSQRPSRWRGSQQHEWCRQTLGKTRGGTTLPEGAASLSDQQIVGHLYSWLLDIQDAIHKINGSESVDGPLLCPQTQPTLPQQHHHHTLTRHRRRTKSSLQ